ncbi:peptidase M50, partial [Magnetococcales bacterium HHB-1]
MKKTFSESWYQVANARLGLRPTVTSHRRIFRGEVWHLLHDPFNNQFFRLRPEAYDFIARLSPDQTVEAVWKASLERFPENAPGQEEVVHLLTQLHFANLLYYNTPVESDKIFRRHKKRRQREMRSRMMSILFLRIPLFDPDLFLKRIVRYFHKVFTVWGLLIWLTVVGMAIKVVIENHEKITSQAEGILAPDNLFILYIALILIKTIHELGHAITCRHYGGEVHILGVMLLLFTPLPFMDATSSWGFQNRWHRVLVGLAGMMVEIFIAALAVFVWINTASGTVHALAYNILFIASVSTLLFNLNPLLRFDGYYILSDLLDIPNLHQRSRKYLHQKLEQILFGLPRAKVSPSRSEASWLGLFALCSGLYRIVIFVGIMLFVADQHIVFGVLMGTLLTFNMLIMPIQKLIRYLISSPRLRHHRFRAITVSIALFLSLTSLIFWVPFAERFRAPGVVQAKDHLQVVNDSPGYVTEIFIPSGQIVEQGTPLLKLSNRELELDIQESGALWQQILIRERQAER